MRCSRYVNGGRIYARLNGELSEEVDYFKYLASQLSVDLQPERDLGNIMNEGYEEWGALKCAEQ